MGNSGTTVLPKFLKGNSFSLGNNTSPLGDLGNPNKRMDKLSAKHKELYDRFEMGQTSEREEAKMYRLEDRMDKVGKKIKKKKSPASMYGGKHI